MTTKTFKRYEIKYLVSRSQCIVLQTELKKQMVFDRFCKDGDGYMIYNIYFDTEDDDIIRHSLSKPYYKEKLRLRSYTMPTCGKDTVFLELKKKIGGVVAKRRTIMSYNEAMEFLENGKTPQAGNYQDKQIMCEITKFLDRFQAKPKLYLSYERIAFFDKDNTEFRVSFDKNILTRRTNINLIDGDFGFELLENGNYLMEIKCAGQIPLWLCRLLSGMKIYKTAFSKYGEEYKRYIHQEPNPSSAAIRRSESVPEFIYPQIIVPA